MYVGRQKASMCMYIIRICIYIYIYIYICACICACVCMCICKYVYMYVCRHLFSYLLYFCPHIRNKHNFAPILYTQLQTCTRAPLQKHTHLHTQTQPCTTCRTSHAQRGMIRKFQAYAEYSPACMLVPGAIQTDSGTTRTKP